MTIDPDRGGLPRRTRRGVPPAPGAILVILLGLTACGGHRHGAPATNDRQHVHVEIHPEGSNQRALREGAAQGLANVRFALLTDRHGDVELLVKVTELDAHGPQTVCKVKILVLRLPQHDLIGVADGGGRAGGFDDRSADDCITAVTDALIHRKVRGLLKRQLDAKR